MSLARKRPFRQPKRAVMVVVGSDVEEDYVHWLKKVLDHTEVPIERAPSGSEAIDVVRLAVARKRAARRDGNFYEIWCLVDASPTVAEAAALAARMGIRLVISDPTFSCWLLMHFEDVVSVSASGIARALLVHLPALETRNIETMNDLLGKYDSAARRARAASVAPTSDMPDFVDTLRESLRAYRNSPDQPDL